jgi:hypothetical protein
VKKAYPTYFNQEYYGQPYPFNCTSFPWDSEDQELKIEGVVPGDDLAVCSLNPYYCTSQDTMDEFYAQYLAPYQQTTSSQFALQARLTTMSLDDQCSVAQILVSRAQYDGDMAGSGAALDPFFWIAHGAVERLMQKIVFEGVSTDATYDSTDTHCSGHMNTGTKYWLKGFFFEDESIVAEEKTNVELNEFLNPSSDYYKDLFNFVYDSDSKWINVYSKACS